jgi:CDP-2,3-bis-(O-geranylgeranyl)-sn-glycerol synthase
VLAIAATSALSPLIGVPWKAGAIIAAGAMAGDLMSSFVKRRMKLASSSMALGIDQIPEALVPAIVARSFMPLTGLEILLTTVLFFGGELLASRILFALKVRDRPY